MQIIKKTKQKLHRQTENIESSTWEDWKTGRRS